MARKGRKHLQYGFTFTEDDLARLVGKSRRTLRRWRQEGKFDPQGPRSLARLLARYSAPKVEQLQREFLDGLLPGLLLRGK